VGGFAFFASHLAILNRQGLSYVLPLDAHTGRSSLVHTLGQAGGVGCPLHLPLIHMPSFELNFIPGSHAQAKVPAAVH